MKIIFSCFTYDRWCFLASIMHFCNQYYENIEQDFLELNDTNERILIDNNQLKLFKNQLMVELGEKPFVCLLAKLWQKEEGTFVTLSTDPNYRYQCIGLWGPHMTTSLGSAMYAEEEIFIRIRREKTFDIFSP